MENDMEYEVIDYFDADGEQVIAISINGGEFEGAIFSYGKVEFPNPDEPTLSFDYTVHEGDTSSPAFKQVMGDILVEILEDSLRNKETVFSGGI
jgi:hypothetical protein